jgi:hypothetical protein
VTCVGFCGDDYAEVTEKEITNIAESSRADC